MVFAFFEGGRLEGEGRGKREGETETTSGTMSAGQARELSDVGN